MVKKNKIPSIVGEKPVDLTELYQLAHLQEGQTGVLRSILRGPSGDIQMKIVFV